LRADRTLLGDENTFKCTALVPKCDVLMVGQAYFHELFIAKLDFFNNHKL